MDKLILVFLLTCLQICASGQNCNYSNVFLDTRLSEINSMYFPSFHKPKKLLDNNNIYYSRWFDYAQMPDHDNVIDLFLDSESDAPYKPDVWSITRTFDDEYISCSNAIDAVTPHQYSTNAPEINSALTIDDDDVITLEIGAVNIDEVLSAMDKTYINSNAEIDYSFRSLEFTNVLNEEAQVNSWGICWSEGLEFYYGDDPICGDPTSLQFPLFEFDITINTFNMDFIFWEYFTDLGDPFVDMDQLIAHETLHGIGFSHSIDPDPSDGTPVLMSAVQAHDCGSNNSDACLKFDLVEDWVDDCIKDGIRCMYGEPDFCEDKSIDISFQVNSNSIVWNINQNESNIIGFNVILENNGVLESVNDQMIQYEFGKNLYNFNNNNNWDLKSSVLIEIVSLKSEYLISIN